MTRVDFTVDANTYTQWAETEGHTIPDSVNLPQLVKAAKRLVQERLQATRATGVGAAAIEATHEQVAFWIRNTISPDGEGLSVDQVVSSAALLGGSVSFDTPSGIVNNRQGAASSLCRQAELILTLAGVRFRPRHPGVVG